MTADELDELDSYADDLLDYRADLIAENETALGAEEGERIAWGQMLEDGVISPTVQKMWVAQDGACPVCEELDGQIVALDELFQAEDDEYDAPPEPHVYCRCSTTLVNEGEE